MQEENVVRVRVIGSESRINSLLLHALRSTMAILEG